MFKNKLLGLVLVLFLSAIYVSCDDLDGIGEIDDIAIEGEYAFPIINTSLSISDLFDEDPERNSLLEIAPNGDMTIVFDEAGPSENFNDLVELPASIPFEATPGGFKVNLQPGGPFTITSIDLKSGILNIDLTSSMQEDVDVTVMIPEMQNGGNMFTAEVQLNYSGGMMTESIGPIDVSNYIIELVNNEITVMYIATSASGPVDLDQVSGIASNWQFSTVKGNWNNQSIDLTTEQILIDIYENWESGELSFAEPAIRLDVTSNVGFPSGVAFDVVSGMTVDNQSLTLSGAIVGTTNTLNFPNQSEIGESKTTSININPANSNIAEFFTSQLREINLELSVNTNTGDLGYEGFITDDASISTDLHVELPIYGAANGFTLSNAFDADLTDVENVKEAEITIEIENGIPIELDVQLYFRDINGSIVDSLFNQTSRLVDAANIDAGGNVTGPSSNLLIQNISEQRAAQIFTRTKTIDVQGIVSTANGGDTDVRLNSNQSMKIDLSAIVKIKD